MKKIKRTIIVAAITFVATVLLGTFALDLNIQYRQEKELGKESKNILYYLYGIKNFTLEEKVKMIQSAEFFPEKLKKLIDAELANKIFPDKDIKYCVDTNFVLDFHKENGNPEIFFGCYSSFWFGDDIVHNRYIFQRHAIILTTFADSNPGPFSQTGYFEELAHAKQWTSAPKSYIYQFWTEELEIGLLAYLTGADIPLQNQPGTVEYEAHQIISPKMKERYFEYRKYYFRKELAEIDQKIEGLNKKIDRLQKAKKISQEKKEGLNLWPLQTKKDSLLFANSPKMRMW